MSVGSLTQGVARLLAIPSDRLLRVFSISLPIIGAMLSQSIMNLVDAAIVGRLGDTALAGVGIGAYATFVMVSVVMGLSAAVQALVARRFGAGDTEGLTSPLYAGLQLAVLIGIPLALAFYCGAQYLIPLFNKSQQVLDIAIRYFEWRTIAIVAVGMNFVFRGFWNGIGEGRIYFRSLLTMHIANVLISYILVFGVAGWEGMGAVGAGIGTTAAQILGTLLLCWQLFITHRKRFYHHSPTDFSAVRPLMRLALPNSAQQTLFAVGNSILFWIIGQVGTEAQAIGHILISLALMMILPAVGLGMASTSLVGHALGKGHAEDAYRWGWDVVKVATLVMAVSAMPLWLFPEQVLRVFTPHEPLISLGTLPLQVTGLAIALEVTAMVLTQALLGAGASRQVMRINLTMQWFVLLPLAYIIGPIAGYGLLGIWLLQSAQRITLSAIYGSIWKRRQWSRISL